MIKFYALPWISSILSFIFHFLIIHNLRHSCFWATSQQSQCVINGVETSLIYLSLNWAWVLLFEPKESPSLHYFWRLSLIRVNFMFLKHVFRPSLIKACLDFPVSRLSWDLSFLSSTQTFRPGPLCPGQGSFYLLVDNLQRLIGVVSDKD